MLQFVINETIKFSFLFFSFLFNVCKYYNFHFIFISKLKILNRIMSLEITMGIHVLI
jgi:hypothetical protein